MSTTNSQYKFKEGDIHQFKIIGFTEIPGTDESFFILENKIGGKHLLKSNPFEHYKLEINQIVTCKIDKVNCSGKFFLEPENPIYKEGESYDFDFVKVIDHINSVGEKEKAAIVRDQFGIEIICSLPYDFVPNRLSTHLKCKVLRIKKGQLFLAHFHSENFNSDVEIGKVFTFDIIDIKVLEDGFDYYILKDKFGNLYSLKKDMYQHYGYNIGDKIDCTTTKYNTDGHIKIEPVHPYYKVGKYYKFKYLKTLSETNPLGDTEHIIMVLDFFNVETKVRSQDIDPNEDFSDFIECKVDGIRKGKAILSLINN